MVETALQTDKAKANMHKVSFVPDLIAIEEKNNYSFKQLILNGIS